MLKDIFSSVSKKMQIDFEDITSKINHNVEKGTARENMLEFYLKGYIPEKYCFAKGTIVDCKDVQSKQVDIIIHDKFITPYLVDMDSTKIIPIESVYSVIEVKSTLSKEELRKSIKNIESVRKLEKKTITGISYPTAGLIFAYDSDSSLDAIYKNLVTLSNEVGHENRVSCVCVLSKGIIIPVDKNGMNQVSLIPSNNTVYAMINNSSDSLLLFYLILTQILNGITIFPPDLVAYAQSSDMLNTSFSIPADYVPDDAKINILNNMASIAEIKNMQDYGTRMLSGELNEDEILECIFGVYIPSLQLMHGTLDMVPDNSVLNFFEIPISNKLLIKMYEIYKKDNVSLLNEKEQLKAFNNLMCTVYNKHRDEMKKNRNKKQ